MLKTCPHIKITMKWFITILLLQGLLACSNVQNLSIGDRREASKSIISIKPGKDHFTFKNWDGPAIPVWTYVPKSVSKEQDVGSLPILIVMHGTKRDGDRYRDEWAGIAEQNGFVIVAPTFSKAEFPKSSGYNLGGVFEKDGHTMRPESKWTFSAIEPLFDEVVGTLKSQQKQYTIYGHSAGSQFVHRFLFYKPNARVKRYIPANAGWYTLADEGHTYPYGLGGAGVSQENQKAALQKDVLVLLGDQDIDANHQHLRRTPEAMWQGKHRFARGLTFFKNADKQAKLYDIPFGWKVGIVKGATHSNAQMAVGTAEFVR